MAKTLIGGFKTQIWKACSNDHLRPALTHAFVSDGFIYATNAHVAVKQSLEHIHGIEAEERRIIEGKYFSVHLLKQLDKCDIVVFKEDGIHTECGSTKAVYQYSVCGGIYPNVDAVLPSAGSVEAVPCIGFNPKYFKVMAEAMMTDTDEFRFDFNGASRAIVVTANGYDREHQIGILMPVNLHS